MSTIRIVFHPEFFKWTDKPLYKFWTSTCSASQICLASTVWEKAGGVCLQRTAECLPCIHPPLYTSRKSVEGPGSDGFDGLGHGVMG